MFGYSTDILGCIDFGYVWKGYEGTMSERNVWPELRLEEWKDTYATLHMWTQIVGKIKLSLTPPVNHW